MVDGKQISLWISACEDPEYQSHPTESTHFKKKWLDLNENNQKKTICIWAGMQIGNSVPGLRLPCTEV